MTHSYPSLSPAARQRGRRYARLVLLALASSFAGRAGAQCRETLLEAGVDDNFNPQNMSEPASPDAALLIMLGADPASFDDPSPNRQFGHSFSLLQGSCLVAAQLELRAKPLAGSGNDALHLGFVGRDGAFAGTRASAYFGSGNPPSLPALLSDAWSPASYPSGHVFTLDLANLAGGVNLLPDLATQRAIDLYVQDDTSIDFLRLTLALCPCPTPTATPTPNLPVVGFADLHVHQFTNEALAGAWLYGSPTGPVAAAMPRCSGNVPHAAGRNHGEIGAGLVKTLAAPVWPLLLGQYASEAAGADTGLHAGRRHGYCQENSIPGPGLCRGNAACNLLSQANCTPTHVCEWKSIGSLCRDKPGDGISVGTACNVVSSAKCNNTCSWDWPVCRGNAACNLVSKSNCKSNVCSMQSAGSLCRDRDGDGKSVGLACNTLGVSACAENCSWDAGWGSITLHAENRAHDWTDRRQDGVDHASWPAWDAIAHQQVHTSWLQEAYQGGLRLLVMSALNNEAFCTFLPSANRAPGYRCGDMENVLRQLDAAIALGADPSTPWYQIAYSAAQARDIINQGKLAVILSVEASDIFNTADPLATLQSLYAKGARTLQPLHQFNSKLGGVAWHEGMIKTLQTLKNLPNLHHLCKDDGGTGNYAKCDATKDQLNFRGLTRAGKRFVIRMMNLGMPIDIAHMSELSVKDVATIVTGACDYPVYLSHGHVRSLLAEDSWKADKRHEKASPDWELDLVQQTGGMFGLRTGADHHEAAAYFPAMSAAGLGTALPSKPAETMPKGKPGGNEFHFAYALDYLFRAKGVHVALGSDLNGLIPQMVFEGEPQDAKFAGLAHIGKLPYMLAKVQATGIDSATFAELRENSAEAYLQMWQRATAFAAGTACCPQPSVVAAVPPEAWYGRANRIVITGSGFTPHASLQVSLQSAALSIPISCTDVEFLDDTSLRCTVPPLSAATWYQVTVTNGTCNLSASNADAYYASPTDSGPIPDVDDPLFAQADLQTVLADEIPSNGWYAPNPTKIAAVDWSDPAWDGDTPTTRSLAGDHAIEDGYPQSDWEATVTLPGRTEVASWLDLLLNKEDSTQLSDPLTMIAACDLEEREKSALALANRWPIDWRAQMNSLCSWQSNVCLPVTFVCPGGAVVEAVGQVSDATSANCPFDLAATVATCPENQTPTATPTPTPTPGCNDPLPGGSPTGTRPPCPGAVCLGDCDGDAQVTVDELIAMVSVALGAASLAECTAGDGDGNGQITVDEIIAAVNHALAGCPIGG